MVLDRRLAARAGIVRDFLRNVAAIVHGERLTLAAGGLSYFTVLAIVPMLVAFGAIASLFVSQGDIREIYESVAQAVPAAADPDGSISSALENVATASSTTALTVSTFLSVVVGLYAASRVVIGMRMALDSIFAVPVVRSPLLARLLSSVIALIFLILAALGAAALTVVPPVLRLLEIDAVGLAVVNWILAFLLIGVALRWIYQHGPHFPRGHGIRVSWLAPGVWFGAAWIMVATGLLGVVVSASSTIGATVLVFGTAIVLLLWLYLVAFGALVGAAIVEANHRPATG